MKRCKKIIALFLAVALVFSLGFSHPVSAAASKVKVSKVVVVNSLTGSNKSVIVAKGKKVKLNTTVTVTPDTEENQKVTYKSANTKIAKVSKKGVIIGVKPGKTKIIVKSKKNSKKKAVIKVTVKSSAVKKVTIVKPESTDLSIGKTLALKAEVSGKKSAYKTVGWISDNETVATVSKKGVVNALKAGTVKITAMALDGSGKKSTVQLTIKDDSKDKPDDKSDDKDDKDKKEDKTEEKTEEKTEDLVSASVVNAQTITFKLSGEKELKAEDISIFTKDIPTGKYENQLKIEKLTTEDKVNYTAVLKKKSSLYLKGFVQINAESLKGNKSVEVQYCEADVADTIPTLESVEIDKPVNGSVESVPNYAIYSYKASADLEAVFTDNYSDAGADRVVVSVFNKTDKSYINYSVISGDKINFGKDNDYLIIVSSRDNLGTYKYNFTLSDSLGIGGITSIVDDPEGCLTPQMYNANGDDMEDDTEAFQKMFYDAWYYGYYINPQKPNGFKKCKAIYIPSGRYIISGSIIDDDSPITWATFEVCGAGRESTTIQYTADVLFDNKSYATKNAEGEYGGPVHFAFTTFRDIGFEGNNANTFMNISDNHSDQYGNHIDNTVNPNGVQRLQFISCGFTHCKEIIHTVKSYHMLSEVTFAYCKINNCGDENNENNYCRLFTLNDSMSVDWRYIETDIEGFYGEAFYYESGASVNILGGSYICMNGTTFNFPWGDSNKRSTASQSNSPHLLCENVHFEMKYIPDEGYDSTLLKTTSCLEGDPNVIFRSCKMGTKANTSPHYLILNGAANILFENCFDCSQMMIQANLKTDEKGNAIASRIAPKLKFVDCPDVNVDNLAKGTVKDNKYINPKKNDMGMNHVRVTVNDEYDFYIRDNSEEGHPEWLPYFRTKNELKQCRQVVQLNSPKSTASYLIINNGSEFPKGNDDSLKPATPYGFVEQVELSVPQNASYGSKYPVTVTLYDGEKKLGQSKVITFDAERKYVFEVNAYVDNLHVKFEHSYPGSILVGMNMEIVKY